jgi:uncharacterized iron-regulated protein
MKRNSLPLFLFCLTVFFLLSCDLRKGPILRTADGAFVSPEEMADDLERVPLVFLGELHNEARHHEMQLRVIRTLHKRGRPVAIGLEMFHDGHQEDLDAWVAGEMPDEEFYEVYRHNWSSDWPLYRDIFLYARDNSIPMVGLNAPPDITEQVSGQGFDSLTPAQLARLPGVSCNVSREYETFIRKALEMHKGQVKNFRYFCEAQMVWDTTMAWKVLQFLETNPESTMVVLTGTSHAWKKGIPDQVRQRGTVPFRTVLPEIKDHLDRRTITAEETDYLWTDP